MGRKRAVVASLGPDGLDEAGLRGCTQHALLEKWQNQPARFLPSDIKHERDTLKRFVEAMPRKMRKFCYLSPAKSSRPYLETTVLNADWASTLL